jgi:hypothetical protein
MHIWLPDRCHAGIDRGKTSRKTTQLTYTTSHRNMHEKRPKTNNTAPRGASHTPEIDRVLITSRLSHTNALVTPANNLDILIPTTQPTEYPSIISLKIKRTRTNQPSRTWYK